MTDFSFTDFNLLEGAFWLFCGGVSLLGLIFATSLPKRFWKLLSINFALFAASDLTEAYYPVSFLDHGGEWLFAWKVICIFGFFYFLIWYALIRMKT